MMAFKFKTKSLKKGYSLIEIIISLAITGFAITVMFSFLILSLQISILSLSRSFVREEISNITGLIARDIRNADFVIACGTTTSQESCQFVQNGQDFMWQKCDGNGLVNSNPALNTRVCKYTVEGNNKTNTFLSSQSVKINNFNFSQGYTDAASEAKTNIIILVNASHSNSNYNINNVVRQISVSTRNF
jgi:prepilin-type N-terminal cleavage/methylation domain-containing protein